MWFVVTLCAPISFKSSIVRSIILFFRKPHELNKLELNVNKTILSNIYSTVNTNYISWNLTLKKIKTITRAKSEGGGVSPVIPGNSGDNIFINSVTRLKMLNMVSLFL